MFKSLQEKIKSASQKDYTLHEIFVENYEKWLAIPLVLFLLAPIIHIIIFSINYKDTLVNEEISHFFTTGEYPGDYFVEIIKFSIVIGFLFTIVGTIARVYFFKEKLGKENKSDFLPLCFFSVFCILAIISVIVNKTESSLIWGFTERGEGFSTIIACFVVFYLSGSMIRNEKIKYTIIYIILFLSVIFGVLGLVNNYVKDIDIIYDLDDSGLNSVFSHFNFYGYFLTITIMLAAASFLIVSKKTLKIFSCIAFLFNSLVLAINNTLGCFLACLVAFIFMVFIFSIKNKRFCFSAFAIFCVFILVCFISSYFFESFFTQLIGLLNDTKKIISNAPDAAYAGTSRWELWTYTWKYIKEKPFIGWGYDGTYDRLQKDTSQGRAHNEYLTYAASFGIPATIFYISGLMSIFLKALKKNQAIDGATLCCLVASLGYIGSAFFGNALLKTVPYFFIILGLSNNTSEKR